ncbi:MAG: response regulator, partial [Pseudomonadota bacterium]|nr:response regulator [Pseudomonadota bacterium]
MNDFFKNEALKILVVDDSEDDRLLYGRALRQIPGATCSISEAADGEEAMQHLQKEQPSCILLDYSLPGRNGLDVLKRIRARHPFVPVVMLTGQGSEAVAVAAIQEGAQNYLVKSAITPDALQRTIQVAIEHCIMQRRIHEQQTSLEIFTRALAHDLKEPVRTIVSFLELIASNEKFSEKSNLYLEHVQHAAERMNRLIDTVYFYTRLDDPAQQVAKDACDVAAVLEDVKQNLSALIEERKATITYDALPQVYANRMQLVQVLQNLLANAIRHCQTTPSIRISAEDGANQWLFSVKDNGPGIEEAHRHKVFEPFKRLNHDSGLGLGLAICKKIIESHGGRIWYESNPDAGATFLFTLPRLPAVSGTEKADSPAMSAQDNTVQPGNKRLANLLLVDDSRADIDLIKIRLLERARLQCNFMVARNGEEALDLLHAASQQPIDLMLVDINMPEMDGFELLERMN